MASRFVKDFSKKAVKVAYKPAGKIIGGGLVLSAVATPLDIKAAVDIYNIDAKKDNSQVDYIPMEHNFDQPSKYDEMDGTAKQILNVDFVQGVQLTCGLNQGSQTQFVKSEASMNFGKPVTDRDPNGINANATIQLFSADGHIMIGAVSEDALQARYFLPLHPAISLMAVGNLSHSGEEDMVMGDLSMLLQGATFQAKVQSVTQATVLNANYTQAVAPHTAMGVEMTHVFGQASNFGLKLSHSTYDAAPKVVNSNLDMMMAEDESRQNKRSITTAGIGSNGTLSISHFHKINNQVKTAAEVEYNAMQQASTTTVGCTYQTEVANLSASASSSGQILGSLEFQPLALPGLDVNVCGGFNYGDMSTNFGVGFKYAINTMN